MHIGPELLLRVGSWWKSGLVAWFTCVQPGDQSKKHFVGLGERKDAHSGAEEAFKLETAAVSPKVGSHHRTLPPTALTSAGAMVGSSACHPPFKLNKDLKNCVSITLGVGKKSLSW